MLISQTIKVHYYLMWNFIHVLHNILDGGRLFLIIAESFA